MAHRWKFFRAGGFDQVRLDSGADIAALGELDPKLWVALSCPAKGLELDPHTLDLLDADRDGRVRIPEVIAAAQWVTGLLKNPDDLIEPQAVLPLDAIDDRSAEGKLILSSARTILKILGKSESNSISAGETTDTVKILAGTLFNGDGIIPPAAAGDPALAQAIKDVIACLGPDIDAGGAEGISKPKADQFFREVAAYLEWWKRGEGDPAVLPLGDRTPAAFEALEAVRAPITDYYARCALAAMDSRAAAALTVSEAAYAALASRTLSPASPELKALPLARIEAGAPLPLAEGLNPAWEAAMAAFLERCVEPMLGRAERSSAEEWCDLSGRFAAHQKWRATRPAQSVEKLGIERLRALADRRIQTAIDALIAEDKTHEAEAKGIASVDRLVHLYRDLHTFLNNYVSFRDFYTKRAKAIFQAGTLYLDGRSCELCVRVEDAAKHAALAAQAMSYLAYCDCVRGTEKMQIAAAFTGGDSDFLMPGRNGVFFDRKARDWDATITKVVEQPISIRQSFWQPYKRLGKFVSEQVEKLGSERDKASTQSLAGGVLALGAKPPEGAKPAPFDVAKFAGIFAALGLAVGAIGTALAAVITSFVELLWWQMPLAIFGALLAVSGPSMILAANKLRKRNLGPLLDANGWAINARATINLPFGASLTQVAALPKGGERALTDPYRERTRPWAWYLFFLAIAAAGIYGLWASGHLGAWLRLTTRAPGS